jgi:hypothetical protein
MSKADRFSRTCGKTSAIWYFVGPDLRSLGNILKLAVISADRR